MKPFSFLPFGGAGADTDVGTWGLGYGKKMITGDSMYTYTGPLLNLNPTGKGRA